MSGMHRDEEGPIRRGLTLLQVVYQDGILRIINKGEETVNVDGILVEYSVKPLEYDRREVCKDRRVVEEIRASFELLPGAELRLRMRDVEALEKVCVEIRGRRECYQPVAVRPGEERTS